MIERFERPSPRWFETPAARTADGPRVGWRARIAATVKRGSLDRRLLGGESPVATAELAERAARLVSRGNRLRLAESFDHVVDAAEQPPRFTAQVPLRRREVLQNAPLFGALSRDLEAFEPVSPRGVILATRLLCDGGSPLYAPPRSETLEGALRHARAALNLY